MIFLNDILSDVLHCKSEIIIAKQAADTAQLLIELRALKSEVLLIYFIGFKAILVKIFLQVFLYPGCRLSEMIRVLLDYA